MSSEGGPSSRLHLYILLGLVLGAASGVTVNALVDEAVVEPWLKYLFDPIGQIFRKLLIMTVVPLVFASLAVGVAQIGSLGHLGRVGAKTLIYFFGTTAVAATIGLVLVNTVRPGEGLPPETVARLQAKFAGEVGTRVPAEPPAFGDFLVKTLTAIVPANPLQAAVSMDMLGIIFVALLTGIALTVIAPERARPVRQLLEAIGDIAVFIIHLALRLAPVGVFALIFSVTASLGFGFLVQLAKYVGVVLAGLGIQFFVVFPLLVRFLGGMNPWRFFHRVRNVILMAFSTSSSSATLPTSIQTAEEELRVPPKIAGFVLPLGATMNMNGTSLFEGVTVIFLAQVFGGQLTLAHQAMVVVLAVLTAIGAAGVPGGSIPLLAMVLAVVNVEPGAIALILGVDRILDMSRTILNVVGDLTAAVFVARSEGYDLEQLIAAPAGEPEGKVIQSEHA